MNISRNSHAKLFLVDEVVYRIVQSRSRSLGINYELMVRLSGAPAAPAAREIFSTVLAHSRRLNRALEPLPQWLDQSTDGGRWLLARVDPYLARKFPERMSKLLAGDQVALEALACRDFRWV